MDLKKKNNNVFFELKSLGNFLILGHWSRPLDVVSCCLHYVVLHVLLFFFFLLIVWYTEINVGNSQTFRKPKLLAGIFCNYSKFFIIPAVLL